MHNAGSGTGDTGRLRVTAGLALAYRRYSKDYVGQEAAAQAARRGLWSGRFVAPWDWRQGQRLNTGAANETWPCGKEAGSEPSTTEL